MRGSGREGTRVVHERGLFFRAIFTSRAWTGRVPPDGVGRWCRPNGNISRGIYPPPPALPSPLPKLCAVVFAFARRCLFGEGGGSGREGDVSNTQLSHVPGPEHLFRILGLVFHSLVLLVACFFDGGGGGGRGVSSDAASFSLSILVLSPCLCLCFVVSDSSSRASRLRSSPAVFVSSSLSHRSAPTFGSIGQIDLKTVSGFYLWWICL